MHAENVELRALREVEPELVDDVEARLLQLVVLRVQRRRVCREVRPPEELDQVGRDIEGRCSR